MVWGALPVAGFQYYAGKRLWEGLKVGDALTLVRETDNPHDANAIRIEWRGEMLGHVPRAGNGAVAKLMDKGVKVSGRIVHLQPGRSHWQRILFEIVLDE
ncbi:MAG: HIRAN domain-containing protein [Burkholderiales bacterium]|nr:HIRAN domain-containing protein [Burkholderiales bacterium]